MDLCSTTLRMVSANMSATDITCIFEHSCFCGMEPVNTTSSYDDFSMFS